MDIELWDGWIFSEDQACHWLPSFVEGGEARVHELLKHLDFELLQLLKGRDQGKAASLIGRVFRNYTDYSTDIAVYRQARRELLEALSG